MNREQKQELVIQFYNEGKTFREIAKDVRMSVRDICKIIKKLNGESDSEKSTDVKAFKLFSEGKSLVEVAIELDLNANRIRKLYRDFLKMNHLGKVLSLYERIEPYLPHFLAFFEKACEKNITPQDVEKLVQYANHIPILEKKVKELNGLIDNLLRMRDSYESQTLNLQGQLGLFMLQ